MSAETAAVVAAACAVAATLVGCVTAVVLARQVRRMRQVVEELQAETLPLVHQARVVVDQAASEMERVGDVLGSAEAVSATVDSASRLAYRAFANPVVKVMAFGSGLGSALRRLLGRPPRPARAQSHRRADGHAGGHAEGRGKASGPRVARTERRKRSDARPPRRAARRQLEHTEPSADATRGAQVAS